ncbi:MAG: SpoIIIAH-like family protein [Clostridiales bacterium]|jgi:stage III sporulation protein AH|nr:SpoIIIAH-like family protein [Clostridiales bacterium]
MFVLKRNQVIITALIVMIAVAGYLNYSDTKKAKETGITLNDQGEIDALIPSIAGSDDEFDIGSALLYEEDDDPTIVTELEENLTEGELATGANGEEDPGEAVFVNVNGDSSYFVQAKLSREQARAKEKSLLTEMINNENIAQEKKAEAADSMMEIQKRIEKETAAEAMIEAKGFSEVYVRIDDNSVDVVVNKEALTDAEIAQIEDIVKRKTGMSEDQIHISPMRK